MNDSELLEYWYQAVRSPLGIKLRTNNVTTVRARLYAVRRAANDPRLEPYSINISPEFPDELWITLRSTSAAVDELKEALKDV